MTIFSTIGSKGGGGALLAAPPPPQKKMAKIDNFGKIVRP